MSAVRAPSPPEPAGGSPPPAGRGGPQGAGAAGPTWSARLLASSARWGVVLAFVATVAVFYALEPGVFSDAQTWRTILDQAAIPAIVAMGLTVALIVGDFDLSIGAVIGLGMAIAVSLMTDGTGWLAACLMAVAAGAGIGVVNGLVVTGAKVNSFIVTLAMSSIVLGLDARITGQQTISSGLPVAFQDLGAERLLLDLSIVFWIAAGLGLLLWLALGHTEGGRYMRAVGGNAEAARLAGVRVRTLRIAGFVAAGACAALGGVLLAATSAGYYPNAGQGFLLPAFAAAFLGTAMTGGRFAIAATAFAVLFLQTLKTGLTVLNVETWVVLVVEGLVLAIAVVLGSLTSGRVRMRRHRPATQRGGDGPR